MNSAPAEENFFRKTHNAEVKRIRKRVGSRSDKKIRRRCQFIPAKGYHFIPHLLYELHKLY